MKLKSIVENLNNKSTKEEKSAFLQEVSKYNEYGSSIYRSEDLKRVAEAITSLCHLQILYGLNLKKNFLKISVETHKNN